MPNPSIDRMALAIAQSDFVGDKRVCEDFGISTRTLQRWRHRSKQDSALAASVADKKTLLLEAWRHEAIVPLKTAFEELTRRMPLAKDEGDARVIHAIAGAVKIIGDLRLSADVLLGD